MTTSTATPTITPLGPLMAATIGKSGDYEARGTATITFGESTVTVDFPYILDAPFREGRKRIPRSFPLEGRMRLTLPILTVEPIVDRFWADPATGRFWAQDNELETGQDIRVCFRMLDRERRHFTNDGAQIKMPRIMSTFFGHSPHMLPQRLTDDCWAETTEGYGHITNPQPLPEAVAAALADSLAVGAVAQLPTEGPWQWDNTEATAWYALAETTEPVVAISGNDVLYLNDWASEQSPTSVVLRIDDPWLSQVESPVTRLGDNASRYLAAPTRDEAAQRAVEALGKRRDEMVRMSTSMVDNPEPSGDGITDEEWRVNTWMRQSAWEREMKQSGERIIELNRKILTLRGL